jgi:hypothetical protein
MTASALDVLREKMLKQAKCIYIAVDKPVADDIASSLIQAEGLLTRIQELERERDEIIKTLGCHPAYLLPELMQVMSRADDKPNIDDYRQLQQRAESAESRALESAKDAELGRILMKYIDRLGDYCEIDPVDKIIAELEKDVDAAIGERERAAKEQK